MEGEGNSEWGNDGWLVGWCWKKGESKLRQRHIDFGGVKRICYTMSQVLWDTYISKRRGFGIDMIWCPWKQESVHWKRSRMIVLFIKEKIGWIFVFIMELFVDPYSDQRKAVGSDLMYLMPLPAISYRYSYLNSKDKQLFL